MSASIGGPVIDHRTRVAMEWRLKLESSGFSDFFTPTFRFPVSEDAARRSVSNWIRRCNRGFYGRHWYRPEGNELKYAFVLEIGDLGHRHAHVLIQRPDTPLSAEDVEWMKAIWSKKFGRIDHRPVTDLGKLASYLTKSLWTVGEIHAGWKRAAI